MAEKRSRPNATSGSSKSEIPSNEELINSLVSGLEDCVVQQEDIQNDRPRSTVELEDHAQSKSDDVDSSKATCGSSTTPPIIDEDDCGSAIGDEKDLPSNEDDLVDELAMKDLELTYTDADRERLHIEAEVFKQNGNELFKSGQFRESALAYTHALRTCPLSYDKDRSIYYSNRAAAKMKLELNESAIEDCNKALELDESYLKALFRRAQLLEATDKLDEALQDYKKIIEIDPLHKDALYASRRLPDQIQERNEKLKTEMLGKLKDLGNMFLKPFGLSTENFQLNQDPNSGGYSINMKS